MSSKEQSEVSDFDLSLLGDRINPVTIPYDKSDRYRYQRKQTFDCDTTDNNNTILLPQQYTLLKDIGGYKITETVCIDKNGVVYYGVQHPSKSGHLRYHFHALNYISGTPHTHLVYNILHIRKYDDRRPYVHIPCVAVTASVLKGIRDPYYRGLKYTIRNPKRTPDLFHPDNIEITGTYCMRTKITEYDVNMIRDLHELEGMGATEIQRKYYSNMTVMGVYQIMKNKARVHVVRQRVIQNLPEFSEKYSK